LHTPKATADSMTHNDQDSDKLKQTLCEGAASNDVLSLS